jgi:hypothetical protein
MMRTFKKSDNSKIGKKYKKTLTKSKLYEFFSHQNAFVLYFNIR